MTQGDFLQSLILIAIIAVWTVCFYFPYAYYILSCSDVAGMTPGDFLQGTLLGLVIAVGNQIVYYSCNAISEWARFRDRDRRDYFEVLYYTAAVTINTIMDLWLVIVMAYGYMQDSRSDA